jgi:hypothetical protein
LFVQGELKTFVKSVVQSKDAGLAYTGAVPGKHKVGKLVVEILMALDCSPGILRIETGDFFMNRVPDSELVLIPGGTLITATPEEGRALAITMARHMIHNIQPDLDVLKGGRPSYSTNPDSLIAAGQVVAIEFQTIAAANNYWRK